MCRSLPILAFLVVVAPLQAEDQPRRDDPDYKNIRGRWSVVSMTLSGDDVAKKPRWVVFSTDPCFPEAEGSQFRNGTFESADGKASPLGYFIDSRPPQKKFFLLGGKTLGGILGNVFGLGVPVIHEGAYVLANESLTIYWMEGDGTKLPDKLDKQTKGLYVLELRRGKGVGGQANNPDVIAALAAERAGQRILTGRTTGWLQLWDVPQGKELARWQGHDAAIVGMALAEKAARAASIDADGRVHVWDLDRRQRLHATPPAFDDFPTCAALSPDGRKLYLAHNLDLAELDAETGRTLRVLPAPKAAITSLALSPDGAALAIGTADGVALRYLLNAQAVPPAQELSSFPEGGVITSIAYSKDGSSVFCCGVERRKKPEPGALEWLITFPLPGLIPLSRKWLENPHYSTPVVQRIQGMNQQPQSVSIPWDSLRGDSVVLDSLHLGQDGKVLLLRGKSNLWAFDEPFGSRTAPPGLRLKVLSQKGEAYCRAWHVGGGVVAARLDGGLDWFDANPQPRYAMLTKNARPGESPFQPGVNSELAVSLDGKLLFATGNGPEVSVWDRTGKPLGKLAPTDTLAARKLHVGPLGKALYGFYRNQDYDARLRRDRNDRGVGRWELPRAFPARPVSAALSAPLKDMYHVGVYALLPDEKTVFGVKANAEGRQDKLALWDLKTGRILREFGDPNTLVGAVAVSPDGKLGLAQDEGWAGVTVWNLANGQRMHRLANANGELGVAGMGFTSKGELVTCTSYGPNAGKGHNPGAIVVWDLKTGAPARQFAGSYQQAFVVASAADRILVAGQNELRVYDLNTGQVLNEFRDLPFVARLAISPDGTLGLGAIGHNVALIDLQKPPPTEGKRFEPLPER